MSHVPHLSWRWYLEVVQPRARWRQGLNKVLLEPRHMSVQTRMSYLPD